MTTRFDLDRSAAPFFDLDLISEVSEPIKSGKEANVYRCRGAPGSRHAQLALKVYRPGDERSFKRDAFYREGSTIFRVGGGERREARALRNGSRFGRAVQEATWTARESEVLRRLHAAGLSVPEPVHVTEDALLMELFEDCHGAAAPPLAAARPSAELARALFLALCDEVERMLAEHVLHGDLSPYNVLWNGECYRIIDFPQAVDPRFHASAFALLERDLRNVGRHCARFGAIPDPGMLAIEIWERYLRGES